MGGKDRASILKWIDHCEETYQADDESPALSKRRLFALITSLIEQEEHAIRHVRLVQSEVR